MRSARRRPGVLAALALIVFALGACGGGHRARTARPDVPVTAGAPGSGSTSTRVTGPLPTLRSCRAVPDASASAPAADLPPLPAGIHWLTVSDPGATAGGATAYLGAVPEALPDFQRRVGRDWVRAGWVQVSGEAEPGREAEGVFTHGRTKLSIRARNAYCDTTWTELRLIVR